MGGVFSLDVMLVPLGSCEIVLGVQWLASVGPILWDFEKLRMEFKYKGQRVVLRGTQKLDVEWLEGKRSQQKLHKSAQIFALQIYPVSSATLLSSINNCSPALQQLLDEYKDIFEEPKVLPPHKAHDHRILLKLRTVPVNVRPSRSPYSSPIVLVKKKDGT